MENVNEMLEKLVVQVERIQLDEVLSPAETKLANALAVLIRIVLHGRSNP